MTTPEMRPAGDVPGHGSGAFTNSNAETQPMRPVKVSSPNMVAERFGTRKDVPIIRRSRAEIATFVPSPQILDGLSENTAVDRAALSPWDTAIQHSTSANPAGARAALASTPDYTDHIAGVIDAQRANATTLGENPVNRDTAVNVLATNHPDAPALDAFAREARSLAVADVSDRDVEILLGAMHKEVHAIAVPVVEQRADRKALADGGDEGVDTDLPTVIPDDLMEQLGIDPRTKVDPQYVELVAEAVNMMRDPDATDEELQFALSVPPYSEYLDEEANGAFDVGPAALVPPAEEMDRIGEAFGTLSTLDNPRSVPAASIAQQLHFRAIGIAKGMEAERQARREADGPATATIVTPVDGDGEEQEQPDAVATERVRIHIGGNRRADGDENVPTLAEYKAQQGEKEPPLKPGEVALRKAIAGYPSHPSDFTDSPAEAYEYFQSEEVAELARGEVDIPPATSDPRTVFDTSGVSQEERDARRENINAARQNASAAQNASPGTEVVNPFPEEPPRMGDRRRTVIERLDSDGPDDASHT